MWKLSSVRLNGETQCTHTTRWESIYHRADESEPLIGRSKKLLESVTWLDGISNSVTKLHSFQTSFSENGQHLILWNTWHHSYIIISKLHYVNLLIGHLWGDILYSGDVFYSGDILFSRDVLYSVSVLYLEVMIVSFTQKFHHCMLLYPVSGRHNQKTGHTHLRPWATFPITSDTLKQ